MAVSTFLDFDEYVMSVRDVDHEMLLNNLVRSRWSIQHFDLDGVHIQRGSQGSGDITQGWRRKDGYLLYLPLQNAQIQHANGVALDTNCIVILEPGCEFCLSSNLDHQWCSIFVPTEKLLQIATQDLRSYGQCRVVRPPQSAWNQLLGLTLRILGAVELHEEVIAASGIHAALREQLRMSLEFIQYGGDLSGAREGRPQFSREEIFQRIEGAAELNLNKRLSLTEMAAAGGVSERTVRNIFMQRYRIAPVRYFQLQRLYQIRRALLAAEPIGSTVSAVLTQHGEWEFGRFAQRYRAAFGELPSETLAKVSPA